MNEYDSTILAQCLDDCGKFWWGTSQLLKLAAFAIGTAAVFKLLPSSSVPYVVAILAIGWELALYRSDSIKSTTQSLRRKLEMQDGMGFTISKAEISDLLVRCPSSVKKKAKGKIPDKDYFASTTIASPRRLVENTAESSWWSKHLSEKMYYYCLMSVVIMTLISTSGLVAALNAVSPGQQTSEYIAVLPSIARIVTSIFMLILSLGLIKLILGYRDFSARAAKIEETADRLAAKESIDPIEAINVAHEYGLARASAPLIPEWIWKRNEVELNGLWQSRVATEKTALKATN